MEYQIPEIIEVLYHAIVGSPDPDRWPDFTKDNPLQAHGLWSFYRGLSLGLQISIACLD